MHVWVVIAISSVLSKHNSIATTSYIVLSGTNMLPLL